MSNFVALDIETTGLYPTANKINKIFCIAINYGKEIKVYEDNFHRLKPLLSNPKITKVIHNANFDCFWLRYLYGIEVVNIWDTRLCEQILIGENLPRSNKDEALRKELSSSLLYTLHRYGLADLENKELGAAFAKKDPNTKLTEKERIYVMNDVRYLLQLQAMQEYRLIKMDLMRVANLENKLVEVITDIRNIGIGFNTNIWIQIAKNNHKLYNEALKRLPPTVSNWNSPAQVKKYFNSIGIPVQSLTDIEEFLNYKNPVLSAFINMRKYAKLVNTYGASWLADDLKINTVDHDGRVRADFEQILNTGRLACLRPNLHQLPKDGLHRSAFVPAKGKVFIIGDFEQQEIGIMASASKEEVWIKALLRAEDVHALTASLLYTKEWQEGKEKTCSFPKKCSCKMHTQLRYIAKTINFAIAYGAGPGKIGAQLNLSQKEATKLLNRYKRVVPRLSRWLSSNADKSVKTRMSFSADPFKRRRTLRDPEEWMLRNIGKNNPVQAAGANMIKLSMISMNKKFPIVLNVHDELILEVFKRDAKAAQKELKGIMEKAAEYITGIPGLIRVEPRIATNLLKE